jgi:hypothetical protein
MHRSHSTVMGILSVRVQETVYVEEGGGGVGGEVRWRSREIKWILGSLRDPNMDTVMDKNSVHFQSQGWNQKK